MKVVVDGVDVVVEVEVRVEEYWRAVRRRGRFIDILDGGYGVPLDWESV